MKNNKLIVYILSLVLIISCGKDDDSPSNRPPSNFILLQVENNSMDIILTPQLTWESATDPDGDNVTYSLLLDEGQVNPSTIIVSDLNTTSFTINTSLETNTLYSWKVIALDGNGGITNSEIFSFTTKENQPPEIFNLLQVPNNETNVELNPQLTWENAIDPEADPVTYTVLLDSGIENPITVIASNIISTNFSIEIELNRNTAYFWQVVATDNNGNSTNSEIFTFKSREIHQTQATSQAAFSTRTEHGLIEFNDKLWVIGGYHASNGGVNGGLLNDVWSSFDGINWTEEVPNDSPTSFTPRTNHTTLVFQNKIWVIGGGGVTSLLNDVWSSPDGVNWTQETTNANFPQRYTHSSVVFDDRIWVIGGEDGTWEYNDVWSSIDGVNWVLETNNADFLPRFRHSSEVFLGKIWIIGGINSVQGSGVGDLNDVWSSVDGINWNEETSSAAFSERNGHSTSVFKNRIWVIAGNLNNDVWSSLDGVNWTEEIANANFNGRAEQANIVYNDKLWIVGGWMGSLLNDVWYLD